MISIPYNILSILLITFLFTSCSNDDIPEHIHDHEGIHELVIERTDLNGENPVHYEFIAGNNLGETIYLTSGQTYNFEIIALNGQDNHEHDEDQEEHDDHEDHEGDEHNILHETLEAVEEHFFLYAKSNSLNIDFERTDDAESTRNDGTKIGVKTRITALANSTGNLQIELKHQPTEVNDQANNNFGSSVGGATDMMAVFPIVVE
ncbi:hypothetical protein NMK71_06570 [Weeksellaceae bacterium KMM 9713]|uniref:Uncharacterized protein n=1 Tax=Profundicola chukchiensis TaxID=2961959 RepID=A0A9X4MYR7_9FLAO|nr:hypothetical protein [Profundicola chukchiensis]MDG4946072.1 hypothetical protein [Profundicola chukchiensis]